MIRVVVPEARLARAARTRLPVAALLALAACTVPPAPPPGPPAPAAVLTPQAPMVFPPQPAPPPAEPAPPAVVVLPPPAQPLPPPPVLVPAELVGKPRTEVVTVLGRPDQARTEGGAEVILYQGDSCTLFVFLYEPQAGGAHRVEHVEIGPRGRDLSRDAACLAGLLRRAAAG